MQIYSLVQRDYIPSIMHWRYITSDYFIYQHIHLYIEGILPKGPYPPCWHMADRALLAGYPPHVEYLIVQLSAVLMRPNITWYFIQSCIDWSSIWIKIYVRASYGVSFMRIWEKTDHVIKAPHCIFQLFLDLKGESIAVTLSRPSVLLHTSDMQPMTLKVKAGQLWETGSSIEVTSPRLDHQFYMQQAN